MIIERALNESYLSNSFVVGDRPGGTAVLIDSGGPVQPLVRAIDDNDLTVSHLLCTHHHVDHVSHNDFFQQKYGCPVVASELEADLFASVDETVADGDELVTGDLRIRALLTPGHTKGMLAFVVNDEVVFTGDTLFKGAVGGTLAPGHAGFDDLKRSIMDVLLGLPDDLRVWPGHSDETTIGHERENNPFVRIWRGLDEPEIKRCTAMGRPAALVLRARDYDGGTKCWVRFDDSGDEIAPGSQVVDEG